MSQTEQHIVDMLIDAHSDYCIEHGDKPKKLRMTTLAATTLGTAGRSKLGGDAIIKAFDEDGAKGLEGLPFQGAEIVIDDGIVFFEYEG